MSRRFDGWGGAALAACLASLGGDARADAPRAATGTLFVTANGFEGTRGRAIVAVYANKESWLKIDKAYCVQNIAIGGPTVVARFPEMPPGVYAVSVIHDANSNGKIDMHWFPIPGPDEGAGVSNDAKATFGPPSFDDARFRLADSSGVVTIRMRY